MQNSSLQKGLIFHAPLDEWSGTRDSVSKVLGTNTDTYPVLSKNGSGRRSYNFNGTSNYISVPDNVGLDGFSTFSIIARIYCNSLAIANGVLNKWTTAGQRAYSLYIDTSGNIMLGVSSDGTNSEYQTTTTSPISAGQWYNIAITFSSGAFLVYVNGISVAVDADFSTQLSVFAGSDPLILGMRVGTSTTPMKGSISMLRIFNYALSAQQIINYSKPEYPIEATHRGSGATKNVLDLNAEGMTVAYWYDKTNSLTATISGATLQIPSASNLGARYFNGTSASVNMGDQPHFTLPNINFSIFLKFRPAITGVNGQLLVKDTGGSNREYYITVTALGAISVVLFDSGTATKYTTWNSPNSAIVRHTNYTVGFTYSGIGQIYINGIAVTTTITESGAGGNFATFSNTTAPLCIGNPTSFYNGQSSEVRLYSRILDLDEIKLLNDTN